MRLVVAVTSSGPKAIGSTEAMLHTERTSPYHAAFLRGVPAVVVGGATGGVVDASLVQYPQLITLPQIEREQRPEIRRVLVEQYGIERYMRETGRAVVRLEAGTEIGGAPAAAGQAPAIESDWIASVFGGQHGRDIGGQRKPHA